MRVALMHWNVSSNPNKPGISFTLIAKARNFIRNEFSARKGLHLYRAKANGKKVFFIGSLDSDGSIANCAALYVGKNANTLRPVKNIHELLRTIGIEETQESVSAIYDSVQGYLEHYDYENKQFTRNASAWLHKFGIQKINSFADLVKQASKKHPGKPGSFILNAFFEASMLARHYAYHAYVNQLPREYRAATLGDVALNVLKIPSSQVEHFGVAKNDTRLVSGNTTTLYVHPLTMSALSNAFPALKQYTTDTIRFYPAISSRSGFGKQGEQWRDYHIKVDLPAFMSGWYKILGKDTVEHELDATRFVMQFINAGKVPPKGVNLFLSSEGATCHLGSGVNLATILRPIPENLQNEVLIPAAYLYAPSCCGRSMLEELLTGRDDAEIKNFFEHTLIEPVMRCWEYCLSLENGQGAWGLAPELHGANFYYLYDRKNNTLKPSIAVKDIGSEGIMYRNAKNGETPGARLLNEYDHYFGYLYLAPLINAMSKITGKPEIYFEDIVRESFGKILTIENRRKFLIDGKVVAMHQDPFVQLQKRNLSRTQLWASRPRFRPVRAIDYAHDNLAEFKNTESALPAVLRQSYHRKADASKRYGYIQQLVAEYLRIKKNETNDTGLKAAIGQIKARKYFRSGNVVYIPRQKGTLYVISDLHGDSVSLRKILRDIGFLKAMERGESAHIVFLGDYIHNGLRSLDVLEQILKLKIQYPKNITLLAGTHETREALQWQLHQFKKWHDSAVRSAAAEKRNTKAVPLNSYLGLELLAEYGYEYAMNIYEELVNLFEALPLVFITGNRIVASHGAAPKQTGVSLYNLAQNPALAREMTVNRFSDDRKLDGSATPDKKGYWVSDAIMASFLDGIGAQIFIRGHQHDPAIVGALGLSGRTAVVTSSHINSPESGYYLRSKKFKACYGVFDLERDYTRIASENIKYFTITDPNKTQGLTTTASSAAASPVSIADIQSAYRKPIIGGNLKREFKQSDVERLLTGIAAQLQTNNIDTTKVDVFISPSELYLERFANTLTRLESEGKLPKGVIALGAQNVSHKDKLGAFTGQHATATQLKEYGVKYVIVGHSEIRRGDDSDSKDTRWLESNALINTKVKTLIKSGLIPVVAFGESADERAQGKEFESVRTQVIESLAGISKEELISSGLVLAYEPVWAIGSKALRAATKEEAESMHRFIRSVILEKFGADAAAAIRIQYGGSVKGDNAASLIAQSNIDGGLIGGAAKKAEAFLPIIKAFSSMQKIDAPLTGRMLYDALKNNPLGKTAVTMCTNIRTPLSLDGIMQAAKET
ncbi:MAG: triose-phosphate isomerase, partial [Candidatus Omnitrophica bacterium]|nr:triose-phosphate isomerase [Candidatus Omnitrophota bacterium]